MAQAIRCAALVKRYDGVTAVDGLELEVAAGECFGLLGPNGAGKTTTVEICEGLLEPTAGDVEVLGLRWKTHERELREKIGISLQETHLPDKLTVGENVALFRSFYKQGRAGDEVLELVSLREKKGAWTEKLSGGQKQRLAVACALVSDPELLFLDEPTTGLDPQSRRQLWDVVLGFKARGRTVLLTTHYMDEAERLCDRVAVVDKGRVIALGTPKGLIDSLGGNMVVELATEEPVTADELAALPSVKAVRRTSGAMPHSNGDARPNAPHSNGDAAARQDIPHSNGDARGKIPHSNGPEQPSGTAPQPNGAGFALTVEQLHLALPAILARVKAPTRLSTHQATLEDVFVHLTGRHLRE
jgi:ABC-2 type transport system ATP-binding protein